MAVRGWVYLLANKAMPGLIKIGFSLKDPALRAYELETTGLPHPFVVIYDVLICEPRDVEQAVHSTLSSSREAKEFFRIQPFEAMQSIRQVISAQNKVVLLEQINPAFHDQCVPDEVNTVCSSYRQIPVDITGRVAESSVPIRVNHLRDRGFIVSCSNGIWRISKNGVSHQAGSLDEIVGISNSWYQ